MKKKIRNQYKLKGSIHTVSIRSRGFIDKIGNSRFKECIRPSARKTSNGWVTSMKINPNVIQGDCYSYSDYKGFMEALLKDIGIDSNFVYTRVDFRLDSFDKEHFQQFSKLNKLILSMLAVTYNVRNCYKSQQLFSNELLSMAIRAEEFQAENYDKRAESNGTDKAESRFELRALKVGTNDISIEFWRKWKIRLNKSIQNYEQAQIRYNEELERIYYRVEKGDDDRRWTNITNFLLQYQDCIFSNKQMVNLLERLQVRNPNEKAKAFKKKYKIEYISKSDIQFAVKEVERAVCHFFNA